MRTPAFGNQLRGLRRGEACGLRWCDIDLDNGVLMVNWQVQWIRGEAVLCPPKTPTSVRTVYLDQTTVEALRRHRQRQEAEHRARGIASSGFVFCDTGGDLLRPDYLTRTFQELVEGTGLPPVRLHDLRHGAATLALAAGADLKVVADQLGHSSIVLTADTYTSIARELGLKAAEGVAEMIMRAAVSSREPNAYGNAKLDWRTPSRHTSHPDPTARILEPGYCPARSGSWTHAESLNTLHTGQSISIVAPSGLTQVPQNDSGSKHEVL